MEAMNGWWLSFPIHESLNHDLAIRRFCPARIEQGVDWEETQQLDIIDQQSSLSDTTTTPRLAASEVDEFVDSFINMDHYIEDDKASSEINHVFDQFHDEIDTFSMVDDGFGDAQMMVDGNELDMGFLFVDFDDVGMPQIVPMNDGVDQGLHLVHLLLACAEAVGCKDTQIADSILGQIWASVNPTGDSLQRVLYCFATGLMSRLSRNVNTDVSMITMEQKMEAFRLLYQATPYIAFGFMAANEAICQAAQGKDSLHIIDLGMQHSLQWPSLIRTLASRSEGPPKLVKITGLINNNQTLFELESSMKILKEDASFLGIPLEFNMVSGSVTPSLFSIENLNLIEGEALFVNSILNLHKHVKESRGSLKAILQAIKKLNPCLLTVVEQDANHNGPFFLGRFLESLHYFSAIFDSLEASLPRNSTQRMKIERFHFAEEICNIVAYEGCDRIERHERVDQWRRQLGRAGFQVMGLKCMSQVRMMLSVYGCDGYTLASEKGCLLLGWKGRPIMLASAWHLNAKAAS